MSRARRPNERIFIDSVISTASMTNWSDSEHSCSSASETDSEFAGDSSASIESIEIEGQQDIQDLNVSYDDELLSHKHSNNDMPTCSSGDVTTHGMVDMDVSSTSIREIDTNIPANFQDTVEGLYPAKILLQQNYEKLYAPNSEAQLNIVVDKKFVCSFSKIKSLFQFCHETGCGMAPVEVKEKWIGCTLEIRWKCGAGTVESGFPVTK